ncbi:hypothetical protein [Puniceicoccus vermicola]|uniref:Uncharacterized protein n=1 Tax=Puniceicoccus vermicola TaxID=388746 RepID=A0A7X1E519_9BACT|nr:hypothetical protein [Puniceicoccus vermicola]MBC2601162.1 hypothetical protein [Puniceicoccus vermicola]
MKSNHKHMKAGHFLIDHAQPTEDEIDAMNPAELADFLSENGVDLAKMDSEIPQIQQDLTSQIIFSQADHVLRNKTQSTIVDLSEFSEEQIIAELTQKYGGTENIPLAARNFKSLSREEWESLYKDLILRGK